MSCPTGLLLAGRLRPASFPVPRRWLRVLWRAALGGEVGKNPSGRFVLRVESVCLADGVCQSEAYCRALQASGERELDDVVRVIESHGDQVCGEQGCFGVSLELRLGGWMEWCGSSIGMEAR